MARWGKERHFTTWVFNPDSLHRIELDCLVNDRQIRGHATQDPVFSVRSSEYGIDMSGPNPTALRERVEEYLRKRITMKWEYFIVVYVSHEDYDAKKGKPRVDVPDNYDEVNCKFGLSVTIEVARRVAHKRERDSYPHSGKKYKKGDRYYAWEMLRGNGDWDSRSKSPAEEAKDMDGVEVISCIPMHDDNLAALRKITAGITSLREQLGKFLSQKNIKNTLAATLVGGANILTDQRPK
jgi:hypothetical protein